MKTHLFCALAVASVVATLSTASALDRKVNVVNGTSTTLTEFYASNTGTREWEENILGTDALAPGGSVSINIDDGTGYCKYDFRGVFDDGAEAIKEAVNVCEVGTFTFND